MKKVRFLQQYTVKAHNGQTYEAGAEHCFDDAGARHFISRGVAEEIFDEPKPAQAVAEEVKVDEPAAVLPETPKRGVDAVQKYTKAQKRYREKALKGE